MEEELKKRDKVDKKVVVKKVKTNFDQKELLVEALDTEVSPTHSFILSLSNFLSLSFLFVFLSIFSPSH